MTKYDLCTGDIVLSTKGSYGIVLIGTNGDDQIKWYSNNCLLYTSPSPRDATLSRMPSSA